MKILYYTFIFVTLFFLTTCEKDKSDLHIDIKTNKSLYVGNEEVTIEVMNLSNTAARYFVCLPYEGIPYSIQKLDGKNWIYEWVLFCSGDSYCCEELQPGGTNKDTVRIDLNKGIYRLNYQFRKDNNDSKEYYSNIFEIE